MRSLAVVRMAVVAAMLLALPALHTAAGPSRQPEALKASATVSVGTRETDSGAGIFIPITLSTTGNASLRSFELEIAFPQDKVTYVGTVTGDAGESVQATLSVRERSAGDRTVLAVSVSLPSPSTADRLPDGVLATLLLSIESAAAVASSITLDADVTAWTPGPQQKPQSVTAKAGRVDVTGASKKVVFGCLFYMH